MSVSVTEGQDRLDDAWREHEARRASRDRGGYNAAHRCWACKKFVSGPEATCNSCGQRHGGMNHQAYATR